MLGVSPDLTSPNHNPNTNNNNNNNHTPLRPPDGGAMVAPPAEAQESGGTSGGSCGDGGGATHAGLFLNEEGEKTGGGGGSRWPRQETLALLKIRSDMDLAFRDSSLKGPLWEDVSRKMAELGYHRNAKKCKEKFENVYKYHKRTKEGRSSKADGKTYRFFDQLQALDNIIGGAPPPQPPPPSFFQSPPPPHTTPVSVTMAVPIQAVQPTHQLTVSSTPQNNTLSFNNPFTSSFPQPEPPTSAAAPPSNFFSNSPSSSSSTSSDEDVERRHKRKRKYKDLFESLMKTVVEKQADFQRKFLETLDQREKGRMLREEAWRAQEIERLKNEHHLLIQERSNAAARESTLISLLQKITQNQQNPNFPNTSIVQQQETTPTPPPPVVKQSAPPPLPPPPQVLEPPSTTPRASTPQPMREDNNNNGGLEAFNTSSASSSRWPKAEIDALINLRTYLDNKYQENGPKGPLWEEISSEMKKIGYNRNSKRCKEKWENINKYFKKVKESNKKRPQDSKTCPYFHQLEALYKEKEKYGKPENSNSNMPIIDARPEQQWPLLAQEHLQEGGGQVQNQVQQAMEEREGENNNNNNNVDDDDEEYDDDGEDDDDDEEDEGSGYEIVTNKQPSSVTTTA